jgi:hypothetical protein
VMTLGIYTTGRVLSGRIMTLVVAQPMIFDGIDTNGIRFPVMSVIGSSIPFLEFHIEIYLLS